ncbi:fiber [Egyptian fruit bat adenovirus]|uniref:Fiber n=1 Tax=Egyptian fruit bat adenovirus TaxID=2849732 RepID=A0A344X9V8_9ADEN|nr:fiber [Rousettus aegyptiacus adenovirus]AXE75640.1 fiber [Egyptian fruit bat adenovirus]
MTKRPPPFNPVYPYDVKRTNLMPPFYDEDGFFEDKDGVLSLKVSNPFAFSPDGTLKLKMGSGLALDSRGALESNEATSGVLVKPPLKNEEGKIDLQVDSTGPILLTDQGLTVNTESPLIIEDKKIKINFNNTLENANDELSVKASAPLNVSNSGLGLQIGEGLNVKDGKLVVIHPNILPPLASDGQSLQLNLGSGLQVNNGQLQVKLQAPLTADSENGVTVKTNEGLIMTAEGISVNTGLGLKLSDGKILLNLGKQSGMDFYNSALQVNLGKGLELSNNAIQVKTGEGITVNADNSLSVTAPGGGGKVSMKADAPLKITDDVLSLNFDNMFHLQNGRLSLKLSNIFTVSADGNISLNVNSWPKLGGGLKVTPGGSLVVNTGAKSGITTDGTGTLMANTGAGLDIKNNEIVAKVGHGLTLDNDRRITFFAPTMQTTFPSNNLITENGSFLLSLTRLGCMVHGIVHVSLKDYRCNGAFLMELEFDDEGNLKANKHLKDNALVVTPSTYPVNKRVFMPADIYRPTPPGHNTSNIMCFTSFVGSTSNDLQDCPLVIFLNRQKYSITINYTKIKKDTYSQFFTSYTNFVYLGAEE